MTIRPIPSGGESSSVVARTSATFESVLVVASNGGRRIIHRQSDPVAASAQPCVVYEVAPIGSQQPSTAGDAFEALSIELEREGKTNPQLRSDLNEGRAWVAEAFYGDEPTLASLRLAAGLSQKQLAESTNLLQPHVSRYESGRHEPLVSTAETLASALGVSLEVFARALKNTRLRAEQESAS